VGRREKKYESVNPRTRQEVIGFIGGSTKKKDSVKSKSSDALDVASY